MALVQTHRFNWMGYEGTMSEALNLDLLRHSNMGSLRYSDYNYRQAVVADIRMRLKIIKRELGLLPPEEDVEEGNMDHIAKDEFVDVDEYEGNEYLLRIQRRRNALLYSKGPLVASEDDEAEAVYYHPAPPTAEVQRQAVPSFALAVQSLLVRAGETFVSYLDGSEFVAVSKLSEHNEARRGEVEAAAEEAGAVLPSASEFEVTSLQAALEKREQLRMKLDAVRAASDPSYASRFVRAEERDNSGQPVTNVFPEDGDEKNLSAKLQAAKVQLESARLAYNKRAYVAARRVQKALANYVPPAEL
ncbi:hypothetical protein TraAM80_06291 [Trypanosoma rangeli]|uniref:Uncharacterized protein n=1 Tax=Trypanosoma rangeli TaxID=5698 RepID=A0A3R7KAD6_TRYRA|nr:uncharacterized protein TraAM80_06291 [Trypanosoma rangeli]RNF02591.1 hypothetical protein TraAM80_06291 [Trypanosoma rangeli]|eukprot:RNF02591.1 hypothetical protein TraAM80_06291 [Trypanosoma rangeli]